jgi:hypothetical protein
MKLLLAFKSFLPRRLIVEIGSENWFAAGSQFDRENWFAAGCPIRQRELFRCRQPILQRELVRCRLPNSAARTGSLQVAQFGNENWFIAGAIILAANANS